jgi:hypothetical protein
MLNMQRVSLREIVQPLIAASNARWPIASQRTHVSMAQR